MSEASIEDVERVLASYEAGKSLDFTVPWTPVSIAKASERLREALLRDGVVSTDHLLLQDGFLWGLRENDFLGGVPVADDKIDRLAERSATLRISTSWLEGSDPVKAVTDLSDEVDQVAAGAVSVSGLQLWCVAMVAFYEGGGSGGSSVTIRSVDGIVYAVVGEVRIHEDLADFRSMGRAVELVHGEVEGEITVPARQLETALSGRPGATSVAVVEDGEGGGRLLLKRADGEKWILSGWRMRRRG